MTFFFSKELVRLLLAKCKAGDKDRNLFYIAVEIGIQKKGISIALLFFFCCGSIVRDT